MPLIDNKDIYLEWSLAPMRGKFFDELIPFPSIKKKPSIDNRTIDGETLFNTPSKVESRTVKLGFICDTYDNYIKFMSYITINRNIVLRNDVLNRNHHLEYLSNSNYEYNPKYITFVISFREKNYMQK